jgi:hypothetical protein
MPFFENSETFLKILLAILENDFITLLLAECVIKEEPNLKVHNYRYVFFSSCDRKKKIITMSKHCSLIGGHSNFDQFICVDIMRKRYF